MPNTIDLYSTRRMLEVLEQIPPQPKFLRNTFFRNVKQSDTDTIDIDIVKQGRRVTAYTRPVLQGTLMERGGFETKSYKMPTIKIKMASGADKFMTRSAGETPYTLETPAQRAARALVDDEAYLNGCLDAEEERQAAEVLSTGAITIRNDKGEAIQNIDFSLEASHKPVLTAADKWDDNSQNFSTILAKCRAWRKIITRTGAPAPTHMVVASNVGELLIDKFNPPKEQSHISSIRVDRGQVDITNLPDGVTYIGFFKELGCDIYSYDGTYLDLDNNVKPYIPDGKVILASANARFDRNYAAIQNFHAGLMPVARFPWTWIEPDGRARFLQLESAPLLAPHQIDSIVAATVL